MGAVRGLRADNPGPFTLDGTRTWVVGHDRPAIIDPGPDVERHVRAVVSLVENAERVSVLLTHGHADHAGGLDSLLEKLGAERPVLVFGAGHPAVGPVPPAGIETDAGSLFALATPGHTPDHLAFHWPEARALFSGDHVLGQGDTTWVADYSGCVADYLESLDRLRELDLDVIYPGHGPPITDPAAALDRFERHRRDRIETVRGVLAEEPGATMDQLYERVYGDTVPPGLERAARQSLAALREFVVSSSV